MSILYSFTQSEIEFSVLNLTDLLEIKFIALKNASVSTTNEMKRSSCE